MSDKRYRPILVGSALAADIAGLSKGVFKGYATRVRRGDLDPRFAPPVELEHKKCLYYDPAAVRRWADERKAYKYHKAKKAARRLAAMQVLREYGMTLQEIGDIFGFTREYIRQCINGQAKGVAAACRINSQGGD